MVCSVLSDGNGPPRGGGVTFSVPLAPLSVGRHAAGAAAVAAPCPWHARTRAVTGAGTEGLTVRLALKYPPVAENAPRFAADIVAAVAERSRVHLDYSTSSLRIVDRVIDGLRQEEPSVGPVADMLFGFGAYLGEVLVREAGARWVDFDASQRELFGYAFGITMPDGRAWNPLGKAFKRFKDGPGDSVHHFFMAATLPLWS